MRADLVLSTEAKSAIYLIKTEEGERTCHAFYLDDPLFEQKGGIIAIKDFNMVRPESIPWKDFSLPLPELDYYDYTLKATRKMHGAILKTANELDSQPVEIRMHQAQDIIITYKPTDAHLRLTPKQAAFFPKWIEAHLMENYDADSWYGFMYALDHDNS